MTAMTAKASGNYSQEMIDQITAAYKAEPTRATVDSLANEFDKSARSIISKLSSLGIYQKAERVTKRGEPIVKKEVYVAKIQEALGAEFASLEKMTKGDLEALADLVSA
jgi:hypothetical protein